MAEETDKAKKAILAAFAEEEGDDQDFLVAKTEPSVEVKPLSVAEKAKRDALLKKRAQQWESETSNPILGHYWEDESSLDNGEKFLREYILNMGWKTKEQINKTDELSADSEDEEFLEKVDEFETRYNFRFEEEGGHAIASHARNVGDSVRVKDNGRKRLREEKKARQEAEKEAKLAELRRLRNLKRTEIESRLKEVEKATGNKVNIAALAAALEADFDGEQYDEEINGFLGDDYYEQDDVVPETVCDIPEEETGCETPEEEWETPEGEAEWGDEAVGESAVNESADWYFCDVCLRPIRPGNVGFECKECEDVTLCFNCKSSDQATHPSSHTLKKFKVGPSDVPPSDWQSVLYQMKKKKVKDLTKGKYDELFAMEFEDLIAGDVACRFKYTAVDSDAFGLAPETILTKSDAELNKQVSLRKLNTYRKNHIMKKIKYHDGSSRN